MTTYYMHIEFPGTDKDETIILERLRSEYKRNGDGNPAIMTYQVTTTNGGRLVSVQKVDDDGECTEYSIDTGPKIGHSDEDDDYDDDE
jgi:hypothetical protein